MNYDITDYLFVLRLSQQYMLRYFSGKNYFFILEDLANTIKYSVLDCSLFVQPMSIPPNKTAANIAFFIISPFSRF